MMIIVRQERARVSARPSRRRRLPPDLAPSLFQGRSNFYALRKRYGSASAEHPAVLPPAEEAATDNAPLSSLADAGLVRRFHAWTGHSRRRYICSIFPVDCRDPHAGLPDFVDAIFIAVGITAQGRRFPLAFFDCGSEAAAQDRRQAFLTEALKRGVREWHIHFTAAHRSQRRAVMADLDMAQ